MWLITHNKDIIENNEQKLEKKMKKKKNSTRMKTVEWGMHVADNTVKILTEQKVEAQTDHQ